MSDTLRIGVILSSVRTGRRGEGIARWFTELARAHPGLDPVLLDLKDFPLPDYREASAPRMLEGSYPEEVQRKWVAAVTPLDGFVIVTPEYNHGYPASLKNALDHVSAGWRGKPVAFVSYGGISGGTRCVQQLRQVTIELQMAPLRDEVNIPLVYETLDEKGAPQDPHYFKRAEATLHSLVWWGQALAEARARSPLPPPAMIPPPRKAT